MTLKDPILQQGFEIICKENAELKKRDEQLIKAKEIIEKLYNQVYGRCGADWELIEQAEQFLNSEVKR